MTEPTPSRIPREIWVLVVASFVIAVGYGLISPVLPQYARSFDVGLTAASALVSAFALFRVLFAPAAGALATRFGEPVTYVGGLLIVAVSTGACALATDYRQLLVFRALGGIGSTMFTVSAMGLMVRLAPPDIRGRVSSAYGGAFLLGGISGPLLGGLVALLGMRAPFVIYAVALVVAAVVVAVNLAHARPTDGAAAVRPADLPVMTLRQALTDGTYRRLLVCGFANGWSNLGVRVSLIPLLAGVLFPSLGWAAAAVMAAYAAGNAVMLTVTGRRSDRVGRRPFLLGGLIVGAVFTAALAVGHHLVMLMAVSALAGCGTGMLTPALQASVSDLVGNERRGGKVLAAFQMAQDAGSILGPVAAGQLADRFGFGTAFLVSAFVLAAAALVSWGSTETLQETRA